MVINKTYQKIFPLPILCIVLFFSSCSIKKTEKATSISNEVLIQSALKKLNLKEKNTSFVSAITNPNNKNETIIVIPEVVNETEEESELNSNILITNNQTGKITHQYFESAKTNSWISNAIFIYEIVIDTTQYKLSETKNAFGIIVKFRSQSQPNPYYSEYLSLFVKDKESIKKILDFYPVYEYSGQVNINSCYSELEKSKSQLIINKSKTNDFFDITVKTSQSKIMHQEDENGDCEPIEIEISSSNTILKFDGKTFKELQN